MLKNVYQGNGKSICIFTGTKEERAVRVNRPTDKTEFIVDLSAYFREDELLCVIVVDRISPHI